MRETSEAGEERKREKVALGLAFVLYIREREGERRKKEGRGKRVESRIDAMVE